MAKAKFSKKNPFLALPAEFKEKIESSNDDDIRKVVAEVALNEHENLKLRGEDQDLYEKKLALKEALAQYTEGTKANKLKIRYAHSILEARGKA